jgi:hypothetical protein
MKYLNEKLKLFSVGVIALSFLMAVTLSSCGVSSNYSDDDEATEEVEESAESTDEHPAGEEHPAGDSDEEHPSDSTATAGEHPE